MNYWLLTTEYPPFFGGGISTYCYHTAMMLQERGHRVTVFINDATVSGIKTEQQDGIRIIRFNPSRTHASASLGHVTNISYEFAHIVKYFIEKEGKPDIIEAQEYLGIAYYLLQYKLFLYEWCRDIPVVITMHSPSFLYMEYNHVPEYRYPNYWICEMERFCLQAADHVISPSRYMIAELEKRFRLMNKNITVIPNPYETTNQAVADNSGVDEIVFYGKLTAQKGAFQLLAYFSQLWDEGFARPLYLLGGQDIVYHPEGITMGDLIRKKYKQYIEQGLLKLEGRVKPSDIPTRLARAEVVIIPSNNDNLPYAVLETMALGKILLVSKQGGHAEIIQDGINGFIFDHEQPGTFSQQLKKILALSNTERERIATSAAARIKDNYSHEAIYLQKAPLLDTLCKRLPVLPSRFPFVRPEIPVAAPKEQGRKLSIVIPYFNMGKYIDETIASVREADYDDKEIIIVNDGSTDANSLSKLDAYRGSPGITIIDTPNRGVSHARNTGAKKASGEYLAFLDADDAVLPGYYSRAVAVLSAYENVHFAGCWIKYFGDSMRVWPAFAPEPPLILFHNTVNSSALVYKRQSFLQGGLNDTNMVFPGWEDYESVISMMAHGFAGIALPEVFFRYRIRTDSMIRAVSKEKKIVLYQYISNKHKQFYSAFASDLFNLLNANGTGISLDNPSHDYHLADKLPFGGKMSKQVIKLVKRNRFSKKVAYKLYRFLKK